MGSDKFTKRIQCKLANCYPKSVRRVMIPKPDGKLRPLGIPCIEDYILIKKIQAGNSMACELLIRKHYKQIYDFCVRRCNGDKCKAADITQDVFLKLIKNIHNYRFIGKVTDVSDLMPFRHRTNIVKNI